MVEESLSYIKNFIRDPMVASVSPTSSHATGHLVDGINFRSAKVIVEYGPGNGVITKELLKVMPPDATLLAVEVNENFCHELAKIDDSRLTLINGSAEDVVDMVHSCGLPYADVVVSGIPLSLLKETVRRRIVEETHRILSEVGSFHVYQASKLVKPLLEDYFYKIDTSFVWKNIPPLFILRASMKRPFLHQQSLYEASAVVSGKAG